jgi:hypothetical protein
MDFIEVAFETRGKAFSGEVFGDGEGASGVETGTDGDVGKYMILLPGNSLTVLSGDFSVNTVNP